MVLNIRRNYKTYLRLIRNGGGGRKREIIYLSL